MLIILLLFASGLQVSLMMFIAGYNSVQRTGTLLFIPPRPFTGLQLPAGAFEHHQLLFDGLVESQQEQVIVIHLARRPCA